MPGVFLSRPGRLSVRLGVQDVSASGTSQNPWLTGWDKDTTPHVTSEVFTVFVVTAFSVA